MGLAEAGTGYTRAVWDRMATVLVSDYSYSRSYSYSYSVPIPILFASSSPFHPRSLNNTRQRRGLPACLAAAAIETILKIFAHLT